MLYYTISSYTILIAKGLSRIPMINTSLDYDAETIKYEFDNLVSTVVKDLMEKKESEELSIINNQNN